MKTKQLLLFRGLVASVLIALGLVRIGERLDPIMDQTSMTSTDDVLMRTCTGCDMPPPPGDDGEHQNVRVSTVA